MEEKNSATVSATDQEPEILQAVGPEPEIMPQKTKPKARCKGVNADGTPCKRPAQTASGYCFHHDPDPEIAAKRQEWARKGREVQIKESQLIKDGKLRLPFRLRDYDDAINILRLIASLLVADKLSHHKARAMTEAVRVALDGLSRKAYLERADKLIQAMNKSNPLALSELAAGALRGVKGESEDGQ
jgi:hypothetical protein